MSVGSSLSSSSPDVSDMTVQLPDKPGSYVISLCTSALRRLLFVVALPKIGRACCLQNQLSCAQEPIAASRTDVVMADTSQCCSSTCGLQRRGDHQPRDAAKMPAMWDMARGPDMWTNAPISLAARKNLRTL